MINTDHKHNFKFLVVEVNQNSPLHSKINPGDEILNIIKKEELEKLRNWMRKIFVIIQNTQEELKKNLNLK